MGNRRKITAEEKAAAMAAIKPYLEQGWSFGSAYKQIAADASQEGKTIPAQETVRRWVKEAGWTNVANTRTANTRTDTDEHRPTRTDAETDGTDAATDEDAGAENDDAARDPEDVTEDATDDAEVPETDDYTRRLELIVKLYRTRSEAACDAVCDELLPELLTE